MHVLIDAAAVAANFQRMVCIADTVGMLLDELTLVLVLIFNKHLILGSSNPQTILGSVNS